MTFKQFYLINESPDVVYTNDGAELGWENDDARAFGWLNIVPGVSPFLLYTTQSGATHYEIAYMVLELFQYAKKTGTSDIKRVFRRDFKQYFDVYPSFNKVIDNIAQNKQAWKSIVSGQVEKDYNKQISKITGDENKPVTTEMSDRQLAFKHSGRIWLQSKVISFWATDAQQLIVDTVFNAFKVPNEQRSQYLIDLIDPSNIDKEETKEKKLPTVAEYFSSQQPKAELSKEQEKRVAELMAKRHTETDPTKKKQIQKELEQFGQQGEIDMASKHRIPLDIRQKMMTSEGIKFSEFFKL